MNVSQYIISKVRAVIGTTAAPLHEPCFAGNEANYVNDCIETGWVSSVGSYVDQFENRLQELTGAKKAIALSNGTSALFVALKVLGVDSHCEVLVPSLTFVATANAVSHCHATPHFVDVESHSLGIDPRKLKSYLSENTVRRGGNTINKYTERKIAAMVPVHCMGHPCQMDELLDVANQFGIHVVEDAAESLGSHYKGRSTGVLGKLGVFSFNGNKIVTTGGGGAIVTEDLELGVHIKHLVTTAKKPHAWDFYHDHIGFNFRMPNLNAALGCAQLELLSEFVCRKRKLAKEYLAAFDGSEVLDVVKEPANSTSNYWLNCLVLKPEFASQQRQILDEANSEGIMTRPAWLPINTLPMYCNCPSMDVSAAADIQSRLISIPSGVKICPE